jgi:tetratricopeptide (TPR) repeat protein
LSARGGEQEHELAFGIVRQLLEPALISADAALLAGPAALAAPVLRVSDDESPAEPRFSALHGLYWLTLNLAAAQPLLVLVDDCHWADLASMTWLVYLARRIEGVPLALVVATRPSRDQLHDELATLAETFVPEGLSEAAVARLLPAAADTAFVAACRRATGGNPFLVRELAAELGRRGLEPTVDNAAVASELSSQGVERSVRSRLRQVGPMCAALARAVAVLGDPADPTIAARLADLDDDTAARAATALADAAILAPGLPYAFVHPLVRSSIAPEPALHDRAARLLAEAGAPADRIAVHLLAGRPRGDADTVAKLRRAATIATGRGAAEVALTYLRRALEEPPPDELRPAVTRELGAAALQVGELQAAIDHLRDAVALAATPDERAEAALLLGRALYAAGMSGLAAETFEGAMAVGPAAELRHRLEYELSNALVASLRFDDAVERAERIRRQPPAGDGVGALSLLATLAWLATFVPRGRVEAVRLASAAIADDRLLDEMPDAFWTAALALFTAEDFDRAATIAERTLDRAVRGGVVEHFVWASFYRARLFAARGQLVDGEADARNAIRAVEDHGLVAARPWVASVLAAILLERDRLDEAAALLGPRGAGEHATVVGARAEVHLAQGRAEAALADADHLGRRYSPAGRDNRAIAWRVLAVRALAALERRDEARALAREEVALAERWGAPAALGRALRAAGVVDGVEPLRRAVQVLDGTPELAGHARALAELGAALRRAGQRADAREWLRQALELARACGADTVAARAHDELVAAGARPRRDPTDSRSTLTASELRVARMAAGGMTNRAIAQSLFVTENTIETHMRRVFRKLAIGSRSQLPRALNLTENLTDAP